MLKRIQQAFMAPPSRGDGKGGIAYPNSMGGVGRQPTLDQSMRLGAQMSSDHVTYAADTDLRNVMRGHGDPEPHNGKDPITFYDIESASTGCPTGKVC